MVLSEILQFILFAFAVFILVKILINLPDFLGFIAFGILILIIFVVVPGLLVLIIIALGYLMNAFLS